MIAASPEAIKQLAVTVADSEPLRFTSKQLRDLVAMEAEKMGWPVCEWESRHGEYCVVRKTQIGITFVGGQPRTLQGRYRFDE